MDELQKLDTTISSLSQLLGEMNATAQPRSNFALAHFVVGQHDLPGRQRQQVLAELQAMLFAMGDMYDDACEAELELNEATAKPGSPRDQIAVRRATRKLEALRIQINGRMRECEFLLGLLNKLPTYTLEQLEAEEADYWQRRLSRQHFEMLMGDAGNIDAVIQMFTDPGEEKPQLAGIGDILMQFGNTPLTAAITAKLPTFLGEGHAESH